MDIFSWSMPFVAEKVVEMLFSVIKGSADDPIETDDLEIDASALASMD